MSHDGHGDHPPFLQHHFSTPEQQFSAGKLGMWLFLAQEILFFGGLFCFYAVYRFNNPEVFDYAHTFLDWKMGFFNTVVLLLSSFTMALGVSAAQRSQTKKLMAMLMITFVCAGVFMVVKYYEYSHKYEMGLFFGANEGGEFSYEKLYEAEVDQGRVSPSIALRKEAAGLTDRPAAEVTDPVRSIIFQAPTPAMALSAPVADGHGNGHALDPPATDGHADAHAEGHHFDALPPGVRPRNVHIFFQIYFCLTGLHGIHVLAGMIMLAWLFIGAAKGKYNAEYFTPVDLGGLYWHLVDLVWIYLFPLLYLI